MTYLTCVIILSLQEGVYCADRRLFLSSTSTSLCDVTMKYVGHGDVCDVCGDVCGRGAVKVRILFERDSHVDLWFAMDSLWDMSAWDIKRAVHGVTSALLDEAEVEAAVAAVGTSELNSAFEAAASIDAAGGGTESRPIGTEGGVRMHGSPERTALSVFRDRGDGDRDSRRRSFGTRRRRVPIIVRSFPGSTTPSTAIPPSPSARPPTDEDLGGKTFPPTNSCPIITNETNGMEGDPSTPGDAGHACPSPVDAHSSLCSASSSPAVSNATVGGGGGINVGGADGGSSTKELPEGVLAYRARLRIGSVVLHFRAKGLKPGMFLLFLEAETQAAAEVAAADDETLESAMGYEGATVAPRVTEQVVAGSTMTTTGRLGMSGGGGDRTETATSANTAAEVAPAETTTRNGCSGSDPAFANSGSLAEISGREHHQPLEGGGSGGDGGGGFEGGVWLSDEQAPFWHSLGSRCGAAASLPAMIVLRLTPAGQAPLPSLCCGVCGSSWETDAFGSGEGYRVYHLAVANNALVWYVRRRFSHFLALHQALSRRDKEGGGHVEGGSGIPFGRLPNPPSRTFGMIKLFPEMMERFRRCQLDTYMQELLTIPQAMTNRLVLAFLGLVSTSRHDLMSPTNSKRLNHRRSESERIGRNRRADGVAVAAAARSQAFSSSQHIPLSPSGAFSTPTRTSPVTATRTTVSRSGATTLSPSSFFSSPSPSSSSKKEGRPRSEENERPPERSWNHNASENLPRVAQRQGVRHFPAGAAIGLGQETREAAGGREPNTRRVERVSNLDWVARAGDVFLFRCKGLLSRLQRWFSRSEWDHVGMAVSRGPGQPLELLESTKSGVRRYPLVERVRAYQEEGFATRVAFRRLECPRPLEARHRLAQFALEVEGRAYGLGFPLSSRGSRSSARKTPPAAIASSYLSVLPTAPDIAPQPLQMPDEPNDGGKAGTGDERLPSPENATPRSNQKASDEVRGEKGEGGEKGWGNGQGLDLSSDTGVSSQTDFRSRVEKDAGVSQPTARSPELRIERIWGEDEDHRDKQAPVGSPTYLCSQLIGAALADMRVLQDRGGGGPGQELERWLWVLPGAFGQGGAVERGLGSGVSLGEEILVDGHEPEVATAVLFTDLVQPQPHLQVGDAEAVVD